MQMQTSQQAPLWQTKGPHLEAQSSAWTSCLLVKSPMARITGMGSKICFPLDSSRAIINPIFLQQFKYSHMEDKQLTSPELPKSQQGMSQRELQARYYYEYYKKKSGRCPKSQSIEQYIASEKEEEVAEMASLERGDSGKEEGRNVKIQHSLMILQGLSQGKNLAEIYRSNLAVQGYPMSRLKNVGKLTLQRVSKLFVDLLPDVIELNPKQFYEKYFRTREMLKFYRDQGLDLIPIFQNVFELKDWYGQYKEYLKRGYSKDYLPEEIRAKLALLPNAYHHINDLYSKYGGILKTKDKRKPTKKSMVSIDYEHSDEDEFMKNNEGLPE